MQFIKNTSRKVLFVLMAMMLILLSSGQGVSLEAKAATFDSGNGIAGDPFIIITADQLDTVRNNLNAHYKLGADIDLSGYSTVEGWVPIGDINNRFNGSFDGAGFTISNLTINREDNYQGLFGSVGTTGVIENTLLERVQIDAKSASRVGGLAGWNFGTIKNSSVTSGEIKGYRSVGGLVGDNSGIITNSLAKIDIEGVDASAQSAYIGGLVGSNWRIIMGSSATGKVSGDSNIGGLVGDSRAYSGTNEITNSFATGKVFGKSSVGGLVGYHTALGGTSKINNSYATGDVTGNSDIGGLVGQNSASNETAEIMNTYATGKVTGVSSVGGLVGYNLAYSGGITNINNSYWDINSSGQTSSAGGGEGKSSEEMQQRNTYVNWNFDNIWYQYEGQTMPFLQWQNPVTALDVSIAKDTLQVNETTEITVEVTHEDGQTYDGKDHAIYSANPDIVTIEKGIVTAKKAGETVITIDLFDLKKSVNVKVSVVPVIAPDAPIMSAAPKFVKSSTIRLTGTTQPEATIQITGGSVIVSGTADATGIFEIDVPLNKNTENKLEVTATVDGLESEATKLSIVHDDVKPIITLKGESVHTIYQGTSFTNPGATATDTVDGDISTKIIVSGDTVNTNKLGDYTIHYNVTDQAGNQAVQVNKTVRVVPIPSSGDGGGSWTPSSNANLGQLEVLVDGKTMSLTPSFSSNETAYTAHTDKKKIKLKARTAHLSGKITLNNKVIGEGIEVDLQEGDNIFEFIIEAENGTKKTYTLTIQRKPTEPTKPIEPIHPTEPIAPAPPITFTDTTGHWAENDIQQAAALGIIKGYENGTFKPNAPMTRTQVTSIIVRALGLETDETAPFKDIRSYAVETQAEINAAYKYGFIKGDNGNFFPANKVTRAQLALIIERAYEYKTGMKYNATDKAPYTDFGNYSAETVNAISMLHELDIATGFEGKFNPGGLTTRAHAAKIISTFTYSIQAE